MKVFSRRLGGIAGKMVIAGIAAVMLPASAQEFVPNEVQATANRRLLDPEFNQAKGWLTWVDMLDGSMWVGGIDRSTGKLVPADGRGVLIEKSAAPPGGLGFTLNGPEWVLGGNGDRLVYTRMIDGADPTPENAEMGAAFRKPNGLWAVRTVAPNQRRNAPFGSEWAQDPAPRITYNDALGNHYWRELDDPSTEELIPGLGQGLTPAVRHVRGSGERALVYPVDVNGVPQVHRYSVDTKVYEQLTFDAGKKEQPWMWRAPDFGNNLVLMTTVDETNLALYKQVVANGTTQWSRVKTIQAPLGGRFFSTEPFVYGGKSYAVLMLIVGDYPTSIWLANFDVSDPMMRRLTPELPDRARADPEVFITDNGPIVFFSRFDQTKGSYWLCMPCAEGLYRAETGIGPQ